MQDCFWNVIVEGVIVRESQSQNVSAWQEILGVTSAALIGRRHGGPRQAARRYVTEARTAGYCCFIQHSP